jgi:1-acyl-sn-glycerol-3-phosphate acyltransferase
LSAFIRTCVFRIGLVVFTFALIPMLVMCLAWTGPRRNGFLSGWSRFILWWLTLTCGLRYQVEGADNIGATNAVILCKHQSSWETFGLQAIFPPQTWVLKRELLRIPIFGWGLKAAGAIAIDRGNAKIALKQVIAQGTDRLERGFWVVVFPEGTRTPPGSRGKYNSGGSFLATRSGYPVVPVAHNAGSFWGSRFSIQPGTIRVVIGEPIATKGRKASEITSMAEDWIEDRMAELPLA